MKSKIRSWFLALAFVVAIGPTAAQSPGSIESFINYGTEYLEAGNPSSAVTYFRLAVNLEPDHAEANYLLAVAMQRSGQRADARRHLDRALALNPALRGRPESSEFAPTAPPRKPRKPPTTSPVTAVGTPVDTNGPVGSEYDAATRGDGGAPFQIRSGREELALGGYAFAESYFRVALNMDPGNAAAHFLLGGALRAQGREAAAQAALTRAVSIDPSLASRTNEWPKAPRPVATTPPAARKPAAGTASDRPMTCDEIFGSCAAGATGAARNMCFVRRNQCRAALED